MIRTCISCAMRQESGAFVCTRCGTHMLPGQIEAGMQPKALRKLFGHASIKTNMDRSVHVTDDSLTQAVRQGELNRTI